ncbi:MULTISPECIES: SDR family oxidoreductase [unclassified Gluconobacter]|uniref:SDR family NAD(P)-dependent oxidoreductase n=1 Tax=unclassified Gluconobacter TaxID=2644261 RepID=UPI001C04B969|nr:MULTISPECIES: SDR family oxidoreductase [unclassified Gluconobacter]
MPLKSPLRPVSAFQTVVLTGASGGIGTIVTRKLLDQGHRVVALSRTAPDIAHEALTHIYYDASNLHDISRANEVLLKQIPGVDILIHCAAIISPGMVEDTQPEDVIRQISINLTAPIALTSLLVPKIPAGGRIIIVNSMAATIPLAGSSVYGATKAGLRNFALSLAQEISPKGIAVSSIFPGAVETEMLRQEMETGGSVLNFVGTPATPEVIASEILKLIQKPKLERFFPKIDGIFGGLCLLMPSLLRLSMPLLTFLGNRGFQKFLRNNRK